MTTGRAKRSHNDECRERIRELVERTLEGKARMDAYRQRVAEKESRRGAEEAPRAAGEAGDRRVRRRAEEAGEAPMEEDRPGGAQENTEEVRREAREVERERL